MKKLLKPLIIRLIGDNSQTTSAEVASNFSITPTYASRVLNEMYEEGLIKRVGFTNRTKYVLNNTSQGLQKDIHKTFVLNSELQDETPFIFLKNHTDVFSEANINTIKIVDYVLSEMVNNAIDHSQGKKLIIEARSLNNKISIKIQDDGIGVFSNIQKKFGYSLDDAVLHLMKGKLTTAPKYHSGQGIFFSSKASNIFHIVANGKKIVFRNDLNDLYVKSVQTRTGTTIFFTIDINSKENLAAIFRKYSDEDYEFSKTEAVVHLYKHKDDLISRSQAKRILFGMEKFKTVTLDFKKVDTVGQAFCDEVFRVWNNAHPDIKFIVINANTDVKFMIDRVGE